MDYSDDRVILTREGYEEIQRELNELLTVKMPAVVERIREARQLGDLKENFDYQDGKQVQGMLDARIRELKAILNIAVVVDNTGSDGSINIGSKVLVKDLDEGFEDEYKIVGPAESDPSEGKISHQSCIGSALMGQKVGDTVAIDTPGGLLRYEIVSVE